MIRGARSVSRAFLSHGLASSGVERVRVHGGGCHIISGYCLEVVVGQEREGC